MDVSARSWACTTPASPTSRYYCKDVEERKEERGKEKEGEGERENYRLF
jgi:hypothetical protein